MRTGGLEFLDTPRGLFALAITDSDVAEACIHNVSVGFFARDTEPATLFDKSIQHAATLAVDPALAFEAVHNPIGDAPTTVDSLLETARRQGTLVVRPRRSASSKGSALIIGPDRLPHAVERAELERISGDLHAHVHLSGQPIFVNGVISGNRLSLADCWRCILFPLGCRDILASVVNLPRSLLPPDLRDRLERLAFAFGLRAGPVHAEIVLTTSGPKLVKLAARLATEPLPALCRLAAAPGQRDALERARSSGFSQAVPDLPEPDGFVADYSFVLDVEGHLASMRGLDEIRALPSYRFLYQEPALGGSVRPTSDGYSYGATVFLAHAKRAVLEDDIALLDAMNRRGVFVVANATGHNSEHA